MGRGKLPSPPAARRHPQPGEQGVFKLIVEEYFRVEEERPPPHPRKTIVFAMESIFGRERLAGILQELNGLITEA